MSSCKAHQNRPKSIKRDEFLPGPMKILAVLYCLLALHLCAQQDAHVGIDENRNHERNNIPQVQQNDHSNELLENKVSLLNSSCFAATVAVSQGNTLASAMKDDNMVIVNGIPAVCIFAFAPLITNLFVYLMTFYGTRRSQGIYGTAFMFQASIILNWLWNFWYKADIGYSTKFFENAQYIYILMVVLGYLLNISDYFFPDHLA